MDVNAPPRPKTHHERDVEFLFDLAFTLQQCETGSGVRYTAPPGQADHIRRIAWRLINAELQRSANGNEGATP